MVRGGSARPKRAVNRLFRRPMRGLRRRIQEIVSKTPRDDVGGHSQDRKKLSPGSIGALAYPGEDSADEKCKDRNSEGIDEGIEKKRVKFPIAIGFNVVGKGKLPRADHEAALQATIDQHGKRGHCQVRDYQDDPTEDQSIRSKPVPDEFNPLSQILG